MKKLFGNIGMKWLTVILFAVITGVYTGAIMCFPILEETSFQDIGISYEWWVIFAVIVVTNCNKNYEAMIKCFVFFLISQPLVYAVEVLAGKLTLDMGIYYYTKIWLPMTFLTIPGGFIAFYCKKQNLLGGIVLGLGNTIQVFLGIMYIINAVTDFPHHLLSAVTCLVSAVIMSFCIHREPKYRIVSLLLPVILTGAMIIYIKANGLWLVSDVF